MSQAFFEMPCDGGVTVVVNGKIAQKLLVALTLHYLGEELSHYIYIHVTFIYNFVYILSTSRKFFTGTVHYR